VLSVRKGSYFLCDFRNMYGDGLYSHGVSLRGVILRRMAVYVTLWVSLMYRSPGFPIGPHFVVWVGGVVDSSV
jgi:hypothetical protein